MAAIPPKQSPANLSDEEVALIMPFREAKAGPGLWIRSEPISTS
jgi:hypothetical protein